MSGDFTVGGQKWHRLPEDPDNTGIRPQEAEFEIERRTRADAAPPICRRPLTVIRMHAFQPAIAQSVRLGEPRDFRPARIRKVDFAGTVSFEYANRNRRQQCFKAALFLRHQQIEPAVLADDALHIIDTQRLFEEIVHAVRVDLALVIELTKGADGHNRHYLAAVVEGTDDLRRTKAVHHRHFDIHHDEIKRLVLKKPHRLLAIVRQPDRMPEPFEQLADHHLASLSVVSNQNPQGMSGVVQKGRQPGIPDGCAPYGRRPQLIQTFFRHPCTPLITHTRLE